MRLISYLLPALSLLNVSESAENYFQIWHSFWDQSILPVTQKFYFLSEYSKMFVLFSNRKVKLFVFKNNKTINLQALYAK